MHGQSWAPKLGTFYQIWVFCYQMTQIGLFGNWRPKFGKKVPKGVEHISIVWPISLTPRVDSPPSIDSKKKIKK